MKTKRNEAIDYLQKAAKSLAEAGCINDMIKLADKESDIITGNCSISDDEFDWEYLECSVCGDHHNATFVILKPKPMSHQYRLNFTVKYAWKGVSLYGRIKQALQTAYTIIMGKTEEHDILIEDGEDIRKLRDVFYRMQRNEEEIANISPLKESNLV